MAWLDTGTYDGLLEASNFIATIEKRQGMYVSCIEEIAYRRGFINDDQMMALINELKDGNYKTYLKKVYEEYHELY